MKSPSYGVGSDPKAPGEVVFELILSALILLSAATGMVRKLVGVISWVECQLPLLSPTQEEVRDGIGLSQERLPKSSMESFRAYREAVEDKINSDSHSQHSVEGPERPGLSSFPALTHQENPLEKDTLEVPALGREDSIGTSSGPGTVTPLEASPSTPQDTATITPPVITPRHSDSLCRCLVRKACHTFRVRISRSSLNALRSSVTNIKSSTRRPIFRGIVTALDKRL
ncbi:unnamed protein product [Sphagnum balticum]